MDDGKVYQGLGNIPGEFDVPLVKPTSLLRMSATFNAKDHSMLLQWFVDGHESAKILVPADNNDAVYPVIGLENSAEVISGAAPTDDAHSWCVQKKCHLSVLSSSFPPYFPAALR